MTNIITIINENLQMTTNNIQHNLPTVLHLILLLLGIQIINWLLGYRLRILGIFPRRVYGLPGILFSPFIHGDFNHLFFNLLPFFILSNLLLVAGRPTFICASLLIMLIGGTLTWVFGKRGIHIGASGVIMGYLGYLLVGAYHQPSFVTIGIALVCIYYFASLLLSIVPGEKGVSWEGHLFGLIGGLAANYLTPPVLTYLYLHHWFG